ncbi:MAG: ATP-binding protein [Isosphaeraceae bacterium]|nr:ATP-binding protein [Isosphaeraceae bacterium]
MFKTLRFRLLLGIAPLLAIMVGLGLWAVVMFTRLGGRIDVILKENYRSVLAAEGMKESLERMDSALLFAIGGEEQRAHEQFDEFRPLFEKHFEIERGNVTLPGEQAMVDRLTRLRTEYYEQAARLFALGPAGKEQRTHLYFAKMLPLFRDIKTAADDVLELNQRNMEEESARARRAASTSTRVMAFALIGASVVATAIALTLSRSLLGPIEAVTQGARAMARGDVDQVVPVLSGDELGELAAAFNSMARTIRDFRQAGTARLLRAQKTAQATIDSFPDPIVVVDPSGMVERANPAARRILGVVATNGPLPWTPPPQLKPVLADVLGGGTDSLPSALDHALSFRDDGQERFFLPRIVAIRGDANGLIGAAVVLTDVTKFRLVDQLKSDMVSTVSHELKTPLTGVQMAVHLLLEESVGPLTPKQAELLMAARQDSERLLAMINDLLDLTRIEQGRVALELRPVAPADLVADALARFEPQAESEGVTLSASVGFALPPVLADVERVGHVFDNLVGNALAHTERGGTVRLTAAADDGQMRFTVEDTGEGIAAEHLPRLFEKFYRVPHSRHSRGVGLGLAITREIVAAHGGQIEVASQPGRGTTFTFTLPTAPSNGDFQSAGAVARG